jgi:hypothetical protein
LATRNIGAVARAPKSAGGGPGAALC